MSPANLSKSHSDSAPLFCLVPSGGESCCPHLHLPHSEHPRVCKLLRSMASLILLSSLSSLMSQCHKPQAPRLQSHPLVHILGVPRALFPKHRSAEGTLTLASNSFTFPKIYSIMPKLSHLQGPTFLTPLASFPTDLHTPTVKLMHSRCSINAELS